MEALAARKVRAAIVITAGFKEVGKEGYFLEQKLIEICKANDIAMLEQGKEQEVKNRPNNKVADKRAQSPLGAGTKGCPGPMIENLSGRKPGNDNRIEPAYCCRKR